LQTRFEAHAQTFKDWVRTGGPINPIWVRDTINLKRGLHRAQCRAAGRVFDAEQESDKRCLGAFQVYRQLRRNQAERERKRQERAELPAWQQQQQAYAEQAAAQQQQDIDTARRASMEELVPRCNAVGQLRRFGQQDVAFVCDYCDGFIVWEDLESMPSTRTPLQQQALAEHPNWQATGRSLRYREEKAIVFAPVAVANHIAPDGGEWQARILCPYCDECSYPDIGEEGEGDVKYVQDEGGFPDLKTFQDHLEWYHTAMARPISATNCIVM
jgi:hypothetical protein